MVGLVLIVHLFFSFQLIDLDRRTIVQRVSGLSHGLGRAEEDVDPQNCPSLGMGGGLLTFVQPSPILLGVELFDLLVERLLELERAELVVNLAEGERQFAAGQFVTLQAAVTAAEAKWQAQEN
jgi:hypothetical protein